MILSGGYTMTQTADQLVFVWRSLGLPAEARWVALVLLAALPWLFLFPSAASGFARRHLHWPVSPRFLALAAPILSVLCAAALLFHGAPMAGWRFHRDGFEVRGPRGRADMAWKEVRGARWESGKEASGTALVLTGGENRQAWITLGWITPAHRRAVVAFAGEALPLQLPPAPPGFLDPPSALEPVPQ